MQHARDRIRQILARERLALPVGMLVKEANAFQRGWAGYFRHGNSAHHFDQIMTYASLRRARFMAIRHQRPWRFGYVMVIHRSPDRMGLIDLNRIVVAPRPFTPWRGKPNAGGEGRR
jgi:RNA-directed DNA polymerase